MPAVSVTKNADGSVKIQTVLELTVSFPKEIADFQGDVAKMMTNHIMDMMRRGVNDLAQTVESDVRKGLRTQEVRG
jgi:cytochrome c-type biogenesis protein CcmH/NrfF